MVDIKKMEQLYNTRKALAREHGLATVMLDKMIESHWGFHFADYDIDSIIDTLDYGIQNLSFEEFCKLMDDKLKEIVGNNAVDETH